MKYLSPPSIQLPLRCIAAVGLCAVSGCADLPPIGHVRRVHGEESESVRTLTADRPLLFRCEPIVAEGFELQLENVRLNRYLTVRSASNRASGTTQSEYGSIDIGRWAIMVSFLATNQSPTTVFTQEHNAVQLNRVTDEEDRPILEYGFREPPPAWSMPDFWKFGRFADSGAAPVNSDHLFGQNFVDRLPAFFTRIEGTILMQVARDVVRLEIPLCSNEWAPICDGVRVRTSCEAATAAPKTHQNVLVELEIAEHDSLPMPMVLESHLRVHSQVVVFRQQPTIERHAGGGVIIKRYRESVQTDSLGVARVCVIASPRVERCRIPFTLREVPGGVELLTP